MAHQSLAETGLPPRVQRALASAWGVASMEIERGVQATLQAFEQELFQAASHARNPTVEAGSLQLLQQVRERRSRVLPEVLARLETRLATLRKPPPAPRADAPEASGAPGQLELVDESSFDESLLLMDLATRQESRASLALHLLGQRMGVLAGKPAFVAGAVPLGPADFVDAFSAASDALALDAPYRLQLLRALDRQFLSGYDHVVEALDADLAASGILPDLTYVPPRQPQAQRRVRPPGEAAANDTPAAPAGERAMPREASVRQGDRPMHGWLGDSIPAADQGEILTMLRELLATRRQATAATAAAIGATQMLLGAEDLESGLRALQANAQATPAAGHDLGDIRRILLAQARQQHGVGARLAPQHEDAFDLLTALFRNVDRETNPQAPASALVKRLQLPLLRLALRDPGFFTAPDHPAREFLAIVADASAKWMGEDELDPQLLEPMRAAVNRVVADPEPVAETFEQGHVDLQHHLRVVARKAELQERRHVEAARGREKFEVSRRRAAQVIEELLAGRKLARFSHALLQQAWVDVLTLALVRHGEDRDAWRELLALTRAIVDAGTMDGKTEIAPGMRDQVVTALEQVGYHADEAHSIALHLAGTAPEDADGASRTEISMKLKARARLGEDVGAKDAPESPPLDDAALAQRDRLKTLPFGTWLEFDDPARGVVRRRLSWYSPITGRCVFVNQRGQRAGEESLDAIARLLAQGQARVVTERQGRLIDRAWRATLQALRQFAGRGEPASTGDAA